MKQEFVKKLVDDIQAKVKHNKRSLEKMAQGFGITDQTLVKELSELAIVICARNIIQISSGIEQAYNEIVALYDTQFNLSLRTSHSMMLQQYSTPAPISYLASQYVNKGTNHALYFEPSAGNGLLTIALLYGQTYVNEIDSIRHSNLQMQLFAKVTQKDATIPFLEYERKFDGIITNPPFATLDQPIKADGFLIKHLDHAMAIIALQTMKDSGKAAIIIGGHSTWDSKGRLTKGKNRIFLNYLYNHYNVEDVISINGKKLYTKQGTGFDVRLILINRRKSKPEGASQLKNETLSRVVNSYVELWERVGLVETEFTARYDTQELKSKKLKLRAKALIILQKQTIILTDEYRKRINQEIKETERKLLKEQSYSNDLQNIKRIKELIGHIERLNKILETGYLML